MCSPKLFAFDLNTSQLLKQVEIPHDVATTGKGELVSLTVQAMDSTNTMVSLIKVIKSFHFFGNFLNYFFLYFI